MGLDSNRIVESRATPIFVVGNDIPCIEAFGAWIMNKTTPRDRKSNSQKTVRERIRRGWGRQVFETYN